MRGIEAQGVQVGTFLAHNGGTNYDEALPIACLKSTKATISSMPNLHQIEAIVKAYSSYIYLHPKEEYIPSSVN